MTNRPQAFATLDVSIMKWRMHEQENADYLVILIVARRVSPQSHWTELRQRTLYRKSIRLAW